MAKKITIVTKSGTRLEQLEALAFLLAAQLDNLNENTNIAQFAKQYRETIKEIEDIKGAPEADDEISEILSNRKNNGKSGAVRKNRSKIQRK